MKVDVAVLGGGLAGNLLARQLRRQTPDLSVSVFEPTRDTSRKVGESTVEIASDYLIRRHGLAGYLYDRQLPKNGLRFFFDTEARDAEFTRMSELGSDHLPLFPSFQLDRARFEADLRQMNRDEGVDMRVGEEVRSVRIGEPHELTVRGESEERTVHARWVVDCTGRRRLLAGELDLASPVDHGTSAVWGRFTGVLDLDAIADDPWRKRVRYTSRVLSTNHFCYPGYWIWLIPLGDGVTSVGVVGLKEHFERGVRTPEGFVAFLERHRALASILRGAELLDVGGYTHLAYGTKTFFHRDRYALVGDAAAFVDPFYSPGSDYIAIQNDLVADLVRRDVEGEMDAELPALYDAFMQARVEASLLLYKGQYRALGSFELLRAKWNFDLSTYYNLWLDEYLEDRHLDPRHVRTLLRRRHTTTEALREVGGTLGRLADDLSRRGEYHRANLDLYNDGTDRLGFQREVGAGRRVREINALNRDFLDGFRRDVAGISEGGFSAQRVGAGA